MKLLKKTQKQKTVPTNVLQHAKSIQPSPKLELSYITTASSYQLMGECCYIYHILSLLRNLYLFILFNLFPYIQYNIIKAFDLIILRLISIQKID
jgi:hypothetical protein